MNTPLIPQKLFFRIGEVASLLKVKTSVLRFWETEFEFIQPDKSKSGHRVYQRKEVERLLHIKKLLYVDRFSIEGAKKHFKESKKTKEKMNVNRIEISKSLDSKTQDALMEIHQDKIKSLLERPIEDFFKF